MRPDPTQAAASEDASVTLEQFITGRMVMKDQVNGQIRHKGKLLQ